MKPAASSKTKKRKRDEAEDGGSGQVTFAVHDKGADAVGPVLASFPAVTPPDTTTFRVFQSRLTSEVPEQQLEFASKPLVIAGATKKVEYYTSTETEAVNRGCRYYIGIRNKKTNVLTVRPAPVHVLSRRVKGLDSSATLPSMDAQWVDQRNELGATFGTKKAQKALRAAERRKIDVSAMEDATEHIQENIERNTKLLPTQEEAKAIADSSRLIPPHNVNATTPEEAYKLHDVIPEAEFNAIHAPHPLIADCYDEYLAYFPSNRSEYVQQRLKAILSAPKPDKKKFKILAYIAALIAFRRGGFKLAGNKEGLQNRLNGMPPAVIDGIVTRFTETPRADINPQFTPDKQLLLISHMFVLCLRLDNFAVDTSLLAADMQESVSSINQKFKILGCKIDTLSASELSNRGLSPLQAQNKFAILRVPLQFPKARTGKRR